MRNHYGIFIKFEVMLLWILSNEKVKLIRLTKLNSGVPAHDFRVNNEVLNYSCSLIPYFLIKNPKDCLLKELVILIATFEACYILNKTVCKQCVIHRLVILMGEHLKYTI
jgi:hypothetical protein